MNSSEPNFDGFGRVQSIVIALCTTCPITIIGLVCNCYMLSRIYINSHLRHHACTTLLVFVSSADLFNSIFGPLMVLLRFYDISTNHVYSIYYIGCLHVLFKVTSGMFQSGVQFTRFLKLWSPVFANKLLNWNSLIAIVPGILGIAGFASMFPFTTGYGYLCYDSLHYRYQPLWFRAAYISTTSGLVAVCSIFLLILISLRYIERRHSVPKATSLELNQNTLNQNKILKRQSTARSGFQQGSAEEGQTEDNTFGIITTNLSQSLPNLRNPSAPEKCDAPYDITIEKNKKRVKRISQTVQDIPKMTNKAPLNTNPRYQIHACSADEIMTFYKASSSTSHADDLPKSKQIWLSNSTITVFAKRKSLRTKAYIKWRARILRKKNTNSSTKSNSSRSGIDNTHTTDGIYYSEGDTQCVKTTGPTVNMVREKEHRVRKTGVVSRFSTLSGTISTGEAMENQAPNYKKTSEEVHKFRAFTKQRTYSEGDIVPRINVGRSSSLGRKLVLNLIFMIIILLSGMHNISYFFENNGNSPMQLDLEFILIVLSNCVSIVNAVFNIWMCQIDINCIRCARANCLIN